jgi:signal transduction histidine kinase
MKHNLIRLSQRYVAALRKHLKQGPRASLQSAREVGRQAVTIGLETLDMARIHEQALTTLVLPDYSPSTREAMIRLAGIFFAEAITPIEKTHRTALEANVHLDQLNLLLQHRNADLTTSTRKLREEIVQRRATEEFLKQSERHYSHLLELSRQMHEQMRLLSRQLLSAQEEERKKISRELHDVIAQTLAGINVRLAALKKEAALNTEGLDQNIARTQLLVQESVEIVHKFARELRPTVLDDLGLIPALHTFMKIFREQTGIRVSLAAFAAIEQVNGDKRTVLYRVAQEALTNVARHAQATEAEVTIQKLDGAIRMEIKDNGKGFLQDRLPPPKKNKRLGLLGMRERVEMVNGSFTIESAPGKGTTVQAQVPLASDKPEKGKTRR